MCPKCCIKLESKSSPQNRGTLVHLIGDGSFNVSFTYPARSGEITVPFSDTLDKTSSISFSPLNVTYSMSYDAAKVLFYCGNPAHPISLAFVNSSDTKQDSSAPVRGHSLHWKDVAFPIPPPNYVAVNSDWEGTYTWGALTLPAPTIDYDLCTPTTIVFHYEIKANRPIVTIDWHRISGEPGGVDPINCTVHPTWAEIAPLKSSLITLSYLNNVEFKPSPFQQRPNFKMIRAIGSPWPKSPVA